MFNPEQIGGPCCLVTYLIQDRRDNHEERRESICVHFSMHRLTTKFNIDFGEDGCFFRWIDEDLDSFGIHF